MINCCRIFLTVSQNPTFCMQWDICYCNSSAMMKMVHGVEAKGCRGRLHYLWVMYRNVLEGKTLIMFQLLSWAGFSPICSDMSVKNTCYFCFRLRYWGEAGAGVPESSLFSYLGFHQKEALLHVLEGIVMFWSHAFHFKTLMYTKKTTSALTGTRRTNTSHDPWSVAAV